MRLRSLLTNAALLFLALALSVYAAEGVLRLLAPGDWRDVQEQRIAAAAEQGVAFDTRRTQDVIRDLRAEGVAAYPSIKPFNFLGRPITVEGRKVLPLSGIADVLTVFNGNETGEYLIYPSDERGFHNPKGLHRAGTVDVAVLGDSYVHGAAVPSGEGLVARVRERIPRTLNLGMGASGPLTELAILVEYAQPVRPRIVLWVYYEGNDLTDLAKEYRVALLRDYLDKRRAPWLRPRQREVDRELVRFAEELIERFAGPAAEEPPAKPPELPGFLAMTELRGRVKRVLSVGAQEEQLHESLERFREVLAQARSRVDRWGGKLYFVYLPEYARFSTRWTLAPDAQLREEVLAAVEELEIPSIDVLAAFEEHGEATSLFPFGLPGHYNAAGYQLVADTIVRSLEEDAALEGP